MVGGMTDQPPLRIIADLSEGFQLGDLSFPANVTVKQSKRHALDLTIDGMTFVLTRDEAISTSEFDHMFCDAIPETTSGLGLRSEDDVAKHTETANRALLALGSQIGQAIDASTIVWSPGNTLVGFEYYVEATQQYLEGGPFPSLVQVSFVESVWGALTTKGLDYFADQEIVLTTPVNYRRDEALKRAARIAHDIATNGKIDAEIKTKGLVKGETIHFNPSEDLRILYVDIKIK